MKYLALSINLVALIAIAWTASVLVDIKRPSHMANMPAEIAVKRVSSREVDQQEAFLLALDSLQTMRSEERFAALDGGLISEPVALTQQRATQQATTPSRPSLPRRELTLLASHANDRMAVIDGLLVREGSELSQGGRVAEVNSDSVVVIERHGRQTLKVSLDKLRVGGVQHKQ